MEKVGNGKLVLIQWWVFLYQGAREWGHTIRGTMVETDGRHTKPLSTLRHRPSTSDNYISLQHPVPHSPAWISFIHYPGCYTLIFQQYQHHRCTTMLVIRILWQMKREYCLNVHLLFINVPTLTLLSNS